MMHVCGAAAAIVALSACASSPKKIAATYVSPMKYQSYDCQQIGLEQANVEQRTNVLYHSLKKRNTNDKVMMGVGLLVAWPALLFMKGNNGAQNIEYAQLKGDYEALRNASVARKCELSFYPDLAASAAAGKKGVLPAKPSAPVSPAAGAAPVGQ